MWILQRPESGASSGSAAASTSTVAHCNYRTVHSHPLVIVPKIATERRRVTRLQRTIQRAIAEADYIAAKRSELQSLASLSFSSIWSSSQQSRSSPAAPAKSSAEGKNVLMHDRRHRQPPNQRRRHHPAPEVEIDEDDDESAILLDPPAASTPAAAAAVVAAPPPPALSSRTHENRTRKRAAFTSEQSFVAPLAASVSIPSSKRTRAADAPAQPTSSLPSQLSSQCSPYLCYFFIALFHSFHSFHSFIRYECVSADRHRTLTVRTPPTPFSPHRHRPCPVQP